MFSVVLIRQILPTLYNTFIFSICYQDQLTQLGLQLGLAMAIS